MSNDSCLEMKKIIKQVERLISSKVGVIKGVYPAFTQHFDPQTFSFGTEKTDTSKFFFHRAPERGGAAGITADHAYVASMGEAIERYCCAIYEPQNIVFDSYSNLIRDNCAVHPRDFALFTEKQYNRVNFPYKPLNEFSRVSWVKGFSLIRKQEIFVPAQTVFLPFTRRKDEIPICPITSTGLAAGPSLEFAILTAIYEIIERDAFTIMWLTKLPPLKININGFKEIHTFFEDRFNINNFDYTFYDITLDIKIPTAMVIMRGKLELGEVLGVGCGTRDTMADALKKVLLEVSQLPPWIRYAYQKEPQWTCKEDFSDIDDFDDHGQLYTRRKDLVKKAFSFLNKAKTKKIHKIRRSTAKSIHDQLRACLKELKHHGFDVIFRDLTTCDVKDTGFRVVRVIIPGLIPLHGDHKFPFLGGERIYEVPVKLGSKKYVSEHSLNSYPHPSA